MAEREETYWWHLGRLRIIQSYVRRAKGDRPQLAILNVGCGTGGTIKMLASFGETDNVDISDEAIKYMQKLGYKKVTKVNSIYLPFKDKTYDMVCAFDVLEHIDNQIGALKEWKRVIKDDGFIIITVPAYQWLWSGHDVSLHHKRRYTVRRLTTAAKDAGLTPCKRSYAIVFSIPMVAAFRIMHKLFRHNTNSETSYVDVPRWMNTIFTKMLYLEARLHAVVSFPFGTSVVAVFKKTA